MNLPFWARLFPFLAVLPQASAHASHMRRRFGQRRALLACRARQRTRAASSNSSSSSQRTRIAHESSFRPASRAACLPRTAAYSSCIEQYSRTVRGQLARTLGCDTVCTFFETHPHGRMFQHQNVWWRKCSQSRTYFRFGLRWRHKEHDYRNKYLALVQQVYFASLVLCGFR